MDKISTSNLLLCATVLKCIYYSVGLFLFMCEEVRVFQLYLFETFIVST